MSDSERNEKPKTQSAPAGGPPHPPKKIARGFDDEVPDPRKELSAAEREELRKWLEARAGGSQ